MRKGLVVGVVLLFLAALVGGMLVTQYNALVRGEQAVGQAWSQVENVYQRRSDLVPNLVTVVQGAANFEKNTLTAVVEARSRVGQVSAEPGGPSDAPALQRFEAAQSELSSSLSRLMVVVENYPDIKATQNFLDLQTQLAGAENRINVERGRFNEAAKAYNTRLQSVPTVWFAGALGWHFRDRPYFASAAGAENAPKVDFKPPQ